MTATPGASLKRNAPAGPSPASATPPPAATRPATAGPSDAEWLEEIEFYIGQGMHADALSRIAAARAAGRRGATLDTLEARARAGASTESAEETVVDLGGDGQDRLDEADLSSIAAALDAEFGAERGVTGVPAADYTRQFSGIRH